jgi:hypothetical protein
VSANENVPASSSTGADPASAATRHRDYRDVVPDAFVRFCHGETEDLAQVKTSSLSYDIARRLEQVNDQAAHLLGTLELALSVLPNSSDSDELRHLLALAIPYARNNCDDCFHLATRVLVTLERAGLASASRH